MQDQQQNNTAASTSGSTPQAVGTTATPTPAPIPVQSVVPPSQEGTKSGKGGLLFKAWILPMLIIGIPATAYYISKELIFVDKSAYETIDNHFENVMKFDGKEYSNEDPASEAPAAKEAAAEIPASEAPASEEPATEAPVVEEAVNTDVSEGKISR